MRRRGPDTQPACAHFSPGGWSARPSPGQCAQEMPEGIAAVVEDAGDVFPDERCRRAAVLAAGLVDGIGKLHIGKGKGSARVIQPAPRAGNAERLAWRAADQDVGRQHGAGAHLAGDRGHVAQVGHVGVTVGEHGAREWLDLGEPRGFEAEGLPGEARGLDAAAHAAVQQWRGLGRTAWGARLRVYGGSPVRVALGRVAGPGR